MARLSSEDCPTPGGLSGSGVVYTAPAQTGKRGVRGAALSPSSLGLAFRNCHVTARHRCRVSALAPVPVGDAGDFLWGCDCQQGCWGRAMCKGCPARALTAQLATPAATGGLGVPPLLGCRVPALPDSPHGCAPSTGGQDLEQDSGVGGRRGSRQD